MPSGSWEQPLPQAIESAMLWIGLVGFTLGLSFLLWTRWGKHLLIGKCVILSLMAHLLLGAYFATANVVVAIHAAAEAPARIDIRQVEIVEVPELYASNEQLTGAQDDAGGAAEMAVWDLPTEAAAIDSSDLAIAPSNQIAQPVARQPQRKSLQELPQHLPGPELPLEPVEVQSPEPTEPESERSAVAAETLVRPEQPTPQATGQAIAELPHSSVVTVPPNDATAKPVRSKSAAASPADLPVSDPVPETSMGKEAQVVEASLLAGPLKSELDPESKKPSPAPIIRPEISALAETGRSASGSSLTQGPSTMLRQRLASGGGGLKDSLQPTRRASSEEDRLPPPPVAKAFVTPESGNRLEPAATAPGPLRPFRPQLASRGRAPNLIRSPEIYRYRTTPLRPDIAVAHGGSKESEQAVERALKWFAAHQHHSGRWDGDGFSSYCPRGDVCSGPASQYRDDGAITGLVVLAFLGAGNTHQSGPYVSQVGAAINWLLSGQKRNGDLRSGGGMYSHGIATLALSEAFGMTGDPKLRDPVRRAVSFIVAAQHPTSGGWRYIPGQYGDTSIFGWQVMALKSAALAAIAVPQTTWQKARRWLTLVGSGRYAGRASYLPGEVATPTMTAEAMACRLFLGDSPADPAVREATDYLRAYLPDWRRRNLYYWYYGTLASYQVGGVPWQRWNASMRDPLVTHQRRRGHVAGSWDPTGDPWGREGGRVYTTALAVLCLEIYYRYLPLQSLSSARSPNDNPRATLPIRPLVPARSRTR